jgi:hypothetical protein
VQRKQGNKAGTGRGIFSSYQLVYGWVKDSLPLLKIQLLFSGDLKEISEFRNFEISAAKLPAQFCEASSFAGLFYRL